MYKNRFGNNNLEWLIYHKTKPNQTKPIYFTHRLDPNRYYHSGTESNYKEEVFYILQTPRLEPHHRMQFSVIPRIHVAAFFYPTGEMKSAYSTIPADRALLDCFIKSGHEKQKRRSIFVDKYKFYQVELEQCHKELSPRISR